MNVNDLIAKVAERARYLADSKLDFLRLTHPGAEETLGRTRIVTRGFTRGELIEAILLEEFSQEFPGELP